MREHVINIQLCVSARDDISRLAVMRDLRRQLAALREWTGGSSAVTAMNYENAGEQLAYEAEVRAWEDARRGA